MSKDNKDWKENFKRKLNIEPGVHLGEKEPRGGGEKIYFLLLVLLHHTLGVHGIEHLHGQQTE